MRKITQADIRSIIKKTAAVLPAAAPAKDFSLLNILSPLCAKALQAVVCLSIPDTAFIKL